MAVFFDPILGELRFSESDVAVETVTAHKNDTGNPHAVSKEQVGLGNVDNTSDADKPVSTAQQTALDAKVDAVEGKGLSSKDFTDADKTKLDGIAEGAQVNVIESVKANGTLIGTSAKCVNLPAATTSKYGVTKLNSTTSSTSTSEAATASAVRSAYQLAQTANNAVNNKLNRYEDDDVYGAIRFCGDRPKYYKYGGFYYELLNAEGYTDSGASVVMDITTYDPQSGEYVTQEYCEIFSDQARQYYAGADGFYPESAYIRLYVGSFYSAFTIEGTAWSDELNDEVVVDTRTLRSDDPNFQLYYYGRDGERYMFTGSALFCDEYGNTFCVDIEVSYTLDGDTLEFHIAPNAYYIYQYDSYDGINWRSTNDFPTYGAYGEGLTGSNDPASQYHGQEMYWQPSIDKEFCTRSDDDILAVVNAAHNSDPSAHQNLKLGENAYRWHIVKKSNPSALTVADHTVFCVHYNATTRPQAFTLTLTFPAADNSNAIEFYLLVDGTTCWDLGGGEQSFQVKKPEVRVFAQRNGDNPFTKVCFNLGTTYRTPGAHFLYHFIESPTYFRSGDYYTNQRAFCVSRIDLAEVTGEE